MKKTFLILLAGSLLITACSDDSTSPSAKYYKITWKNYDGSFFKTDFKVKENTTPIYSGSTPIREEDNNYTYTWTGWDPEVAPATSDATYIATFKAEPKSGDKYYTITWKNYNGSVLKTDSVKENTTPAYTGSTPTKPEDSSYTYTFSGWTPTVVAATANAAYTATYKATKKEAEKVTVAAHTLKDTNPPIDIYELGEQVSESTWNSFRNGGKSKFKNNYDYTYVAYYGLTNYQMEYFTKNGYAIKSLLCSNYNATYYEKIGNTTYSYTSTKEGYLRSSSSVDI